MHILIIIGRHYVSCNLLPLNPDLRIIMFHLFEILPFGKHVAFPNQIFFLVNLFLIEK
jgi:hypothetical protein